MRRTNIGVETSSHSSSRQQNCLPEIRNTSVILPLQVVAPGRREFYASIIPCGPDWQRSSFEARRSSDLPPRAREENFAVKSLIRSPVAGEETDHMLPGLHTSAPLRSARANPIPQGGRTGPAGPVMPASLNPEARTQPKSPGATVLAWDQVSASEGAMPHIVMQTGMKIGRTCAHVVIPAAR